MRKLKKAIILFCALLLTSVLFAANDMTIIPLSSPLYDYVDLLYTMEGHAASQGARPWTVSDFKQQLARITPSSEAARKIYDLVEERLGDTQQYVSTDFDLALDAAMAYHTNPENFDEADEWASQVLNDKLISAGFGLYVSDWMAAYIGLSFGFANSTSDYGTSEKIFYDNGNEDRFSDSFATNIPFLSNGDIDVDLTDYTFISIGTPYISLSLGRGQLSWGNGKMGNLILGNTLPYHDYVSISAGNNTFFDYTMVMSFFTHPMNLYQSFDSGSYHGTQFFLGHRFEFRLFSDKLRLTLNEAIMYQSEDNTIDFRVFNPLLIMHGFYIPANANSLASIELEFSPIKTLQLYASFALDDLSVNEAVAPEDGATLNMWGVMGGLRFTLPVGGSYFALTLEGVYTTPFMYHKDSYDSALYSLDFVGTIKVNMGRRYIRRYLSFPFGSDALAGILTMKYGSPFKYEVGLSFFAMLHGITDENSIAKIYGEDTSDKLPGFISSFNPFTGETGEPSTTLAVGLSGTYYILDNLVLSSTIDFIHVKNMDYILGNTQFDIQMTVSLKYSIL